MSTLLRAQKISLRYGRQLALDNVDLTLSAGEVVALIGPNGSGKSSLIRTLLGNPRPDGEISWFDQPLESYDAKRLARRVAYLPQTPSFEPGQTVAEVLRIGRAPYWSVFGIESAEDHRIVAAVAEELGVWPWMDRPVDRLSGGQRQRVLIARCLIQQPAALLLDEPNTYLDLKHQVELCQLLRHLSGRQSIGVLMAVHDLNLAAAYADRIVLLDGGKKVFDGPSESAESRQIGDVFGVEMTKVVTPRGRSLFTPEFAR